MSVRQKRSYDEYAGNLDVKDLLADKITMLGPINMNGMKLEGLPAPSAGTESATKGYVDHMFATFNYLEAVRVASTGNVVLADVYDGVIMDTVTLTTGDRILLKDQTEDIENDVYVVQEAPDPPVSTSQLTVGDVVFVTAGSAHAHSGWLCTSKATLQEDPPMVIGNTIVVEFATIQPHISAGDSKVYISGEIGTGTIKADVDTTNGGGTKLSLSKDESWIGHSTDERSIYNATTTSSRSGGSHTVIHKDSAIELRSGDGTAAAITCESDRSTTFGGIVDMSTHRVTNMGTPTVSTDACTKGYCDLKGGSLYLAPCRLSSHANVVIATTWSGVTLDGYPLVQGDRVLLVNQTTISENGTYICQAINVPLLRSTDTIGPGSWVTVTEGTNYANSRWVFSTPTFANLETTTLGSGMVIRLPDAGGMAHPLLGGNADVRFIITGNTTHIAQQNSYIKLADGGGGTYTLRVDTKDKMVTTSAATTLKQGTDGTTLLSITDSGTPDDVDAIHMEVGNRTRVKIGYKNAIIGHNHLGTYPTNIDLFHTGGDVTDAAATIKLSVNGTVITISAGGYMRGGSVVTGGATSNQFLTKAQADFLYTHSGSWY